MNRMIAVFISFFLFSEISAQDLMDRQQIIGQTNVESLEQLIKDYWSTQHKFKGKMVLDSLAENQRADQFFSHFDENGKPVYSALENESSAKSSQIDQIRAGGSAGLALDGTGIVIGLWDGDSPRTSHQELAGKINLIDSTVFHRHATHVSGILVATGIEAEAKGMAPSAKIDAYNSQDVLPEVASWASAGGMITNHSYIIANPQSDYEKFGIYNVHSQNWDQLSYDAPYLIMCTGASNNGNDNYNPNGSRYDLLASNKLGKNSIVVGACYDVLNYVGPLSVVQTDFTSWGPTDDWRIKPDITAVGINSFSTREASDDDYDTGAGSSFASPIVAGGLALLQQHYHDENAVYMKSATAKALILSTTDEAGAADGPDFSNGWGLFNAKRAAEVITNNDNSTRILELSLSQSNTFTYDIEVDGTERLVVALCWNDPPSDPLVDENYNDPTPMLINDLDLRVTSSESDEFYPWRMEPNANFDNYTAAAGRGDNFRDNIEIIEVQNIGAGAYTVNVSHKGSLQTGTQDFSLIIIGIQPSPASNVEVNRLNQDIAIYPNPVDDVLHIDCSLYSNEALRLSVYDLTGKKQKEVVVNCQETVEISDLSSGTYLLRVQDQNGSLISTKRVVVP